MARALGSQKAGQGLYDLAKTLGAPLRLAEIGMQEDGLARAADIAVANPYWNPRSFTRDEVFAVLDNAFHGRRPE